MTSCFKMLMVRRGQVVLLWVFWLGLVLPAGLPAQGAQRAQSSGELLERANNLSLAGQHVEAEALYRQLLTRGGNDAVIYFNLANLYFRQNRIGPAAQAYRKVTELAPRFKNAYLNLGKLYYLGEDYPRALQTFKKYLATDAVDYDTLILAGSTAQRLRAYTTALRYYERALAVDDTIGDAYVLSAELYRELGDLPRAVEFLEQAELLVLDTRELNRIRGEFLVEAGAHEAAASAFAAVLSANNNVLNAQKKVLTTKAAAAAGNETKQAEELVLEPLSNSAVYLVSLQLSEAFEAAGLTNMAIFELKQTARAFPQRMEAIGYLEFLLLDAKRDEEAFAFFKELFAGNAKIQQTFKNILARAYNTGNTELMQAVLAFYEANELQDEYSVLVKNYLLTQVDTVVAASTAVSE